MTYCFELPAAAGAMAEEPLLIGAIAVPAAAGAAIAVPVLAGAMAAGAATVAAGAATVAAGGGVVDAESSLLPQAPKASTAASVNVHIKVWRIIFMDNLLLKGWNGKALYPMVDI